jgi:hypothetical protein
MPVGDWQFWIVSLAALIAVLYLLRGVLPRKLSPFRRRGAGVKTSLTVAGKSVERKNSRG